MSKIEERIRGSNMMKMCISCNVVMVYAHPFDTPVCAWCRANRNEAKIRYV